MFLYYEFRGNKSKLIPTTGETNIKDYPQCKKITDRFPSHELIKGVVLGEYVVCTAKELYRVFKKFITTLMEKF